jgi:hypothetical protein
MIEYLNIINYKTKNYLLAVYNKLRDIENC